VLLHRLAEGAPLDQVAAELALEPAVMRSVLRDLARRMPASERRAGIFAALAEGRAMAEEARTLGCSVEELRAELQPTDDLIQTASAVLMARTALPDPPAGQVGGAGQGPLRTVPVRFPDAQYQRLKAWSEAHSFPMAVVVRGLVERFLDAQAVPLPDPPAEA
jgi:hypothetical protein